MAGSPDCRGSGGDGTLPSELAQTSGSGRSGGGTIPPIAGPGAEESGWVPGSADDSTGLFDPSGGPEPLDAATAGG